MTDISEERIEHAAKAITYETFGTLRDWDKAVARAVLLADEEWRADPTRCEHFYDSPGYPTWPTCVKCGARWPQDNDDPRWSADGLTIPDEWKNSPEWVRKQAFAAIDDAEKFVHDDNGMSQPPDFYDGVRELRQAFEARLRERLGVGREEHG